ncbi:MAG: trypsin-like serine protease, partial [Microvirga sp.]
MLTRHPLKPPVLRDRTTDDAPLTILEQMELPVRHGEENWHLKRRDAYPSRESPAVREVTLLPLDRLKAAPRDPLPSFIPEEAPLLPGGPRSIGRPEPGYLRRFNGRRVRPLNVTQIFNGESRQVYRDTSYPWVCIGRLFRPDGNWGTATLVGRSVILTASHVLAGLWQPGAPLNQRVTFVPACFDNVSLLGASWTAQAVNIAAWETIQSVDGYDMAICQLDKPMGEWLGYLGARTYDDDWEDRAVWAHAGYPYDFSMSGQRPTYELGISVRDDDSDSYDTLEVETRADSASGQSGGPLWGVFRDGGQQIIGTLSGIEDNFAEPKNTLFAGGNGLVNL